MDKKDKEPKGTAATASKMAASKKPEGESPDLLQQAKQTTNEVVSQVQQQANSQITRQKDTAASELND